MKIVDDKKVYSNHDLWKIFDKIISAIILKKTALYNILVDSNDLLSVNVDIPVAFLKQTINFEDDTLDSSSDEDSIANSDEVFEFKYLPTSCGTLQHFINIMPILENKDKTGKIYLQRLANLKTLLALVTFLAHEGADINQRDSNGNTPLMSIFLGGDLNESKLIIIETILQLKPDLSIKNANGQSVLDLCFLHFQREKFIASTANGKLYDLQYKVLSLLLNSGIKLSEADKQKFGGNCIFQQIILQNTVQEQQAMLVKLSAEVSTLTQQNEVMIKMLQTLITKGNEAQTTAEASPKPGFFSNTSS